jgi:hypothetical protein
MTDKELQDLMKELEARLVSDDRESSALPRAMYTFEDVAQAHDVCLQTVYLWHKAGWIESVKIGRLRRVLPEQLERFNQRAARGEFRRDNEPESEAA